MPDRKVSERWALHLSCMTSTQIAASADIDPAARFAHVPDGEGVHLHFLNHLATVKVEAGESASGLGAVEFAAPEGFGPPLHVHREEDELFYVLDGQIRAHLGGPDGSVVHARAGDVLLLPSQVPHTFCIESPVARMLTVFAGRRTAPSFDQFVRHLGVPTSTAALPTPVDIDPGAVAEACARHGMQVLGPPPSL